MTKIELRTGKKLGFDMWFVVVRHNGQVKSIKSFMSEQLARTEYMKLVK